MSASRPRLDSLDLLRGLVMVVMALDHARDYFHSSEVPELIPDVDPFLFATRWITHFCAPVFVFLAGTSAFLYGSRPGRTTGQVSRFLLLRGLWLVLLELTVVKIGWLFSFAWPFFILQVIWAIGISMICLALLVWLPRAAIAAIAFALILGHNLLDTTATNEIVSATMDAGGAGPADAAGRLWSLLHVQGFLYFPEGLGWFPPGLGLYVAYPLVPWMGVIAAGYVFGALMQRPAEERRRVLFRIGAAATAAFVVLRAGGFYGDPTPWVADDSVSRTVISFLNTEKYPPSLQFLLMTLGPALIALSVFERARGALSRWLVTIGRVPLFFYVAHIYLIHALSKAWLYARYGSEMLEWSLLDPSTWPADYSWGLGFAYLAWAAVVVMLYLPCRWFAGLKQRSKSPILSYL